MPKTSSRLWELLHAIARRFDEDRCMQTAASLAFTTLISIVPLVAVTLVLASAFPAFEAFTAASQKFVVDHLVPQSAAAVATYTEQFSANAGRLTVLGTLILGGTAVALLLTIDRAFNGIWRVRRPRPLLQRLLVYLLLLVAGPALIGGSLSITSWLLTHSLGLVRGVPGAGIVLLKAAPVLLTSAALALLYFAMPNRRISARDAVLGGLLAGVAFEIMKRAFALYVTELPTYRVIYGAFAVVPVFLVWIYLSWLVVLAGAVAVAVMPEWRALAIDRRVNPGSDFQCAMEVLKVLWLARESGRAVTLSEIHRQVRSRMERVEALLESMVEAAWVGRAPRGTWTLRRDPALITAAEVFRRFAFSYADRRYTRSATPEIDALGTIVSRQVAQALAVSIDSLFRDGATGADGKGEAGG